MPNGAGEKFRWGDWREPLRLSTRKGWVQGRPLIRPGFAGPPSPRGEGFGGGKEAFHLGYRAALHTLKAAVGHDAVTGMLHDILLTEYDLGVLRTSMEQERMDAAAPPEE